jgi:hypothetical protein
MNSLGKKEKQLKTIQDKIFDLDDVISSKSKDLRVAKTTGKSERVAAARNVLHKSQLLVDGNNRSSDRNFEIRQYTKVDADVWQYDDLRSWYCKYGPAKGQEVTENKSPAETGYTIRMN